MTGPAITIEPATPEDYPQLRTIQLEALAEPSPDLLAAGVEGPGLALVARHDRPVGYALALLSGEIAYVPELAVSPDRQRQGIGTALLEGVRERAVQDGIEELRLTVRAGDADARAFYRDRGFEILEELPEHYETGSGTGLLLRRPL